MKQNDKLKQGIDDKNPTADFDEFDNAKEES